MQRFRSLTFLQDQLPKISRELMAEVLTECIESKCRSVDLSRQSRFDQWAINVENQLNELTFHEAEVSQLFKRTILPTVLYWRKNKRLERGTRAPV